MHNVFDHQIKIREAMKEYASLGMPIIPLCDHEHKGDLSAKHLSRCACAGKSPLTRGWTTQTNTTYEQINAWVKEFKRFNVGLPLGSTSGYIGIDIDGSLGETILQELSEGQEIPKTWEYITGSGRRLLYTIPAGMKTKKSVNTGNGDHQECSILAEGQQTVLPPSIHYTGRIYEWKEGCSPEEQDCVLAPNWLLDLVRDDTPSRIINKKPPGTIDLTVDSPSYVATSKKAVAEISPIIMNEDIIASEFIAYETLNFDDIQPIDTAESTIKTQKEEDKIDAEFMSRRISAGGRDNHMTKVVGHLCALHRNLGKDYIMNIALMHNTTYMDPPLDEYAIKSKVEYFWANEEMKSAQYKSMGKDKEHKKFAPLEMAQAVLNILEKEGKVLKYGEPNTIWICDKDQGPWEPVSITGNSFDPYLFKVVSDPALGGDPSWAVMKNYREVANSLRLLLQEQQRVWIVDETQTETQSATKHKYIPVAGGKLIDWKTGKILPWDPETHLTYVIPVDYDPMAKCPNWEKRLTEWLPEEQTRMVLQEYIGYTLIPYMGLEKALMIRGGGANGKSIFIETIQKMYGPKVIATSSMRNIFDRFGKYPLIGKIVNIANEAGSDYLKSGNADDFKNLVSGGSLTADIKNRDPIKFNNTAKLIFSANHDIKTSDKSHGWGRRILIIPFEQTFSNHKITKTQLMDELEQELQGIFNWALKGLQRLMTNGAFTESAKITSTMKEYLQANDIAEDFMHNCMRPAPLELIDKNGEAIQRGVATAAVVDLFKMWCEYKSNPVQKHTEKIKEVMAKRGIIAVRKSKKYLTMTDASKTSCWAGYEIRVKDADFLEWVISTGTQLSTTNIMLRKYIQDRLDQLNEEPDPRQPPPNFNTEAAASNQ